MRFTWALDLLIHVSFQFPFWSITTQQPLRRQEIIAHNAISVLPGTHLHLIQVKNVRVKCLDQGHNIETMSQYWKRRNPAPSGMRNRTAGSNVLTIAPRPSLFKDANSQIIYLVTDILCCRLLLISNLSVKSSKSPSCRQSWAKGEGFCWILLRTHHRGELVFCVGPHDVFPDSLAWPAYWFSMDRSVTLNEKNQTLFLITDWWMLASKV